MRRNRRFQPGWAASLALLSLWSTAWAAQTPSIPANELVRKTVQNEIRASEGTSAPHMFVSHKESSHGSQTKLYCETKDAIAGMAIANDGKPLTAAQRQAEEARLEELMKDPAQLRKKRQREKEDAERVTHIVRAMPDAFIYEYDGVEPATDVLGKPGNELIRLKFRPNPTYEPPSHTEQVLEGMEGTLLVDANSYRIARINGTLYKDVAFGWGILGHLDKGGHFLVEQGDVGDGTWDIRKMSLAFTGKILLFKHLDIKSTEVLKNFRPVPRDLSFAQGVELLKKQENTLAENNRQDPSQNQK
jgi:hypothetical protein